MEYLIRQNKTGLFDHSHIGHIDQNMWNFPTVYETAFQMVHLPGRGFAASLFSFEKNLKTEFHNPGDPVWTDSCLEIFANFAPDRTDRYFNIEISAGGGVLIGVGNNRDDRLSITDFCPYFLPQVTVTPLFWRAFILIPEQAIEKVFGKINFVPGYTFCGNFFKCKEETPDEHFQSWSAVSIPKPDFHRPEYFGTFRIE